MKTYRRVLLALALSGAVVASSGADEAPDDNEPLSQAEVMTFVEEYLPQLVEELRELKREATEAFEHEVNEVSRQIREFREVREHAPEVAQAMIQSHRLEERAGQLAERIAQEPEGDEREALTNQLRGHLGDIFELRMREPEFQVQQLDKELEALRAQIATRRQNRAKIIEKRLDELLMDADDELEWW